MRVRAVSDVGKRREKNEDSYCNLVHPSFSGLHLAAVADGMGGHKAGEVASRMATEFLRERFSRLLDLAQPREWLVESIQAANAAVVNRAKVDAEFSGMGTTLTAAVILDYHVEASQLPESVPPRPNGAACFFGHVGDSRLYLFRRASDRLKRVTDDHSLVGELLRNGDLTEEEAQRHPQRNYLTQALGTSQIVDVDSGMFELQQGDIVVLCTDGLSSLLPEEELQGLLVAGEFDGAATRLVNAALARGGHDNVTAVLVQG